MIFFPSRWQTFKDEYTFDKFQAAFVAGDMVYRYAVIMHILATTVHVMDWLMLINDWPKLETVVEIGKIFLIPL